MNLVNPYGHNLQLQLPDGNAGTMGTLWVMAACVDDAIESGGPVVRLATRIAAQAGRGIMAQLRAVYDYLAKSITFKRDPVALEHVRHPDQLAIELEQHGHTAGDCDDVATLGAALLRGMGIKPALVVVSAKPNRTFHHVLFAAWHGRRWVYLDPQERMFDRLPKQLTRTHVFSWR